MTPRPPSQSPRPAPVPEAHWFYADAIDEADRDDFIDALEVDGLDQEVALLRLHVRRLLTDSPEDPKIIHAAVRLLINALLAQRRLTDREAEGITEAMATVLEQFGEVMRGAPDA